MKELNSEIKAGAIKPLYLLYGSERFLLQKTVALLINAVAPGDNPFNLQRLDADSLSVAELLNNANTLPFFAAKKLIIVDNCPWFANKKRDSEDDEAGGGFDQDALLAYLQNPAETTVVVFVAGEGINKAKKLSKAVAKCGVIQEYSAIKGNNALIWLDEELVVFGLKMAGAAKQQLLLNCEYNCALIHNELAKLQVYLGERTDVTLQDVERIVTGNAAASIFNLVDNVAAGNLAASQRALEQVVLSDAPESIIPRLADHFETLYMVKVMQRQGHTTKEIMEATGKFHSFVIEKSGRQAAKYSEKQLEMALRTLQTADKKHKSGVTDALSACETAIIQICLMGK